VPYKVAGVLANEVQRVIQCKKWSADAQGRRYIAGLNRSSGRAIRFPPSKTASVSRGGKEKQTVKNGHAIRARTSLPRADIDRELSARLRSIRNPELCAVDTVVSDEEYPAVEFDKLTGVRS